MTRADTLRGQGVDDPFASYQASLDFVCDCARDHATALVEAEFAALGARFPRRRWSFVQGMGCRYVTVEPSLGWLMPEHGILSDDAVSRWRSWGWVGRFPCVAFVAARVERIHHLADDLEERFRRCVGDLANTIACDDPTPSRSDPPSAPEQQSHV